MLSTAPPLQAATGTSAFSASRLPSTLSPSARITSASGPTNTIPRRSQSSANSGCSATKPQPTHAASAPRLGQRPLELVVIEVAALAQAVALVGLADEQRVALGLDVKRDDPDRVIALPVELAHRADGAHRGLAAIDDRKSPEGTLDHRAPAPASSAARFGHRRTHGVKAAVDVHDLAGDPSGEVGQQEQDRIGNRPGVLAVPADRRLPAPHLRELLEAGDPARRDRAQRAGRNQVHADPARTEVARQVASGRLERRLGDAHPVVHGPRDRRVEVHADDARSLLRVQVGERGAQRLERERARLERRDRAVGGRVQEATAERVLGRERDRVQHAVDAAPARPPAPRASAVRCSVSLTSSSSTSAGSGRLLAARSVRRRARPKLVSTISAPDSWARRATSQAIESLVITPVITSFLLSSITGPPGRRRRCGRRIRTRW